MEILKRINKGFTLIEVMIAMTIFSIIVMFVVDIYIEVSKFYFNSISNRSAQQNVKVAMETITRYIKQSTVADWDGSTACSGNKLVLKTKDDSGVVHDVVFLRDTSLIQPVLKMDLDVDPPTQKLTSDNLTISQFCVSYESGIPAIIKVTIEAEIEGGNIATERGLSGSDKITLTTFTALKAQYNY